MVSIFVPFCCIFAVYCCCHFGGVFAFFLFRLLVFTFTVDISLVLQFLLRCFLSSVEFFLIDF